MECFLGCVIKALSSILVFFCFDFGHSNDDALDQIDSLLAISFEVVAMIYLVYSVGILQAFEDELLDDFDALLFELSNEGEQSEPIISLECVIDELDVAILPHFLDGFDVVLDFFC